MGHRSVLMLIKVHNDLNTFIGLEIFQILHKISPKLMFLKLFGKVESLKCPVGIKSQLTDL